MATLSSLVDRLRLELGDYAQPFNATVVSDGVEVRFQLPVELIEATGFQVFVNSVLQTITTHYTIDYRAGILTMNVPVGDGIEIIARGSHYETFLTADLETFVNTAFLQHSHSVTEEDGSAIELADLPAVEDYLVVILAHIEALWAMITDAAQEIDVRSPDGVNIPVGQRYQQLLALIQFKEAQYKELAQQLGVGLYRIQMFTLRRVSRTTNRLVPVYIPQEFDAVNRGFAPIYGLAGTSVLVKGRAFTGATSVKFNGTEAASFTVEDDETIRAEVPAGATTGPITITTPGGSVTTTSAFTVSLPPPSIAARAPRAYPPIDPQVT